MLSVWEKGFVFVGKIYKEFVVCLFSVNWLIEVVKCLGLDLDEREVYEYYGNENVNCL